ncbi:MAG TPA: M1 family metallopeptidase [Kofleriaceae bacterium]|nr:M1 family metallopeptidase [Kofleriaceae bacterium]
MKRCMLGLVVLLSCGPSKPAVTVPAPAARVEAPAATAPAEQAGLVPPRPTLRLPRNFLPTGYAARLDIDPAKPGFEGSIQIAGNVAEKSLVIWLNARKLAVHKAVAQRPGQPDVALTATAVGDDFLELRAPHALDAGAWTLAIDYAGSFELLNTAGAFKQTVGDAAYVYTQFEAIYARRAFPCFDEPDSKVPWKLTLDVPRQLVAVANAPQTGEAPLDEHKKRVEFAETKPLPSYLVAFGVGPFEIVDAGKTSRGTPVRVVALAHRAGDAAYAARTSPRVIELLEDYFGSPYPYDKIDMLAIPITVGFGAMENAGLITYAETLMLLDARASKERQLRWISVASHELAHQWFGDLVTMNYWDDIWLNEGFASWMQHKITQRFEPAWHDDQAELNTRDVALDSDSMVTARRIRQPIASNDDIFTAFDRITYDKGASILNMFESYLGTELFRRGIREHIARRAWSNATSTDFVAAISEAASKDVGPAFASFLDQPGTPEITATVTCEGGKPSVSLAQRRYLPPGSGAPAATRPWILPVCVAYDSAGKRAEACTMLDHETGTIALEARSCPRWMMPNVRGRGYYRNAFTAAQVSALRDEAWPQLSWTERRAMFHDVRDAASTGKLPLSLALSLVPKLLAGGDRFTIGPASALITGLARMVPPDLKPAYEAWLRQAFGPAALKAGLVPKASDTLDTEITRAELIATVGWRGRDPRLVAEAVKLAGNWRELPQSLRGEVLQIAVDASPELFERTMKDVHAETDRTKRQEMLHALASVRDPRRQAPALELMLDPTLDPRETLMMLFGAAGGGDRRRGAVADGIDEASLAGSQQFFRDHQAAIMKTMPQDGTSGPFARLSGLFTETCQADQREAIADYVKKTFASLPGGSRTVAQNLEQMDQCIARRALLEPEIRGWLAGVKPRPAAAKR